ncbi:MAG TPA: formylglycine-generating enzyme family protein [Candidatus Paceibacterota bacterium]|nr:formylglycine-generating enzyme family protein [Candidatus Paceibacterota bacterium]HSA00758.1 formylglycine-generating enzyme family protein [Candidatus Paceibacterota bacterium]
MKPQFSKLSRFAFALIIAMASLALLNLSASGQGDRFFRIVGPVPTTITGATADGFVTWTNLTTNATFTVQTASVLAGESNWVDYVQVPTTNTVTAHRLLDPKPPTGMVLIPAGSFSMGDTFAEGYSYERPVHTVYVSAFYMDRMEVTKAQWDEVYQWAVGHGYSFEYAGSGKAADHPVHTISWYDAVKWCNARSEREGRAWAYYTDSGLSQPYRTGRFSPYVYVRWDVGYRLPTEAEWEKAARGGLPWKRFPWGDTITHDQANYKSYWQSGRPYYSYDLAAAAGCHPTYATGGYPYTSPVGSFAANGYGLYDMAGNVWEWCWDWWSNDYYASSPVNDPRGPSSGSHRVLRGGCWDFNAGNCRAANRDYGSPGGFGGIIGFRSVLPPGQP